MIEEFLPIIPFLSKPMQTLSQPSSIFCCRRAIQRVYRCCCFIITFLFVNQYILAQQTVTVTASGSGTVVVPAGITEWQVECWGAGGAGGAATGFPAAGGGGGGGAYSRTPSMSVQSGQSYSYRVGTAGIGTLGNGGDGERTWFMDSTQYCASGGPGGQAGAANNFSAAGGVVIQTGSFGQLVYYGGSGGTGEANGVSGGGGGGSAGINAHGNAASVNGGAAVTGGTAGANGSTSSANGASAFSFGAGGAGGRASNSLDRLGGNGGAGKLTFTFNCPTYTILSTTAQNTCASQSALVTLTANPENLPAGNYTITYNQSAPNALVNQSVNVTVTTSGLVQFYTSPLVNIGATTITIASIQSGTVTVCSAAITTNNTAVSTVYTTPTPVIEYEQGNADTVANVSICSFANGGSGRNDMVIASGNPGGTSVIQWQVSNDLGVSWTDAQGPTGTTAQYELNPVYTNVMSVAGTYYFRVIITNGPCVGISNRIRLNVTGSSTLVSGIIGSDQAFCLSGNPVALNELTPSSGGNGSYNYQWQSSVDKLNFSIINGNSNATYDPPLITQTTYFRRITLSGGCRSFSNIVRVRIDTLLPQLPTGIQGQDTVCASSTPVLYSVDSSSDAGSYEWAVPNGWVTTPTANTDSLYVQTGLVSQNGSIQVRAQNACGSSDWVSMLVSLTNGSTASAIISPVAVCTDATTNISIQINGGASPFVIQYTDGTDTTQISNYENGDPISVSVDTTTIFRLIQVQNYGGCMGTGLHAGTTLRSTATGTWLGLQDSSWNNANNWCGGVPGSATAVYIPYGTSFSPVIETVTAHARSIHIDSGAVLTAQNQTIRLYGALTGSGKINAQTATIELCATDAAQTIDGAQFVQKQIRNLRLSNANGVTLLPSGDSLFVTGILDFAASNVVFQTNGKLTMASSARGTSSISDITAGGLYNGNRILGDVTVEKYIPYQPKAWQFLSVPTVGSTFKSAWQEGNTAMANTRPGYGTIMTSHIIGASTSLGFDIYTPTGTTLKVYNSAAANWDPVGNTNASMSNSKGYMLFVRGDRSVTTYNQAPTPTILRTTGTLYTPIDNPPPAVDIPVGVFESVGNPYPCSIDFTQLTKTGGVQNVFYMWDSKLTMNQFSAYGLGGYQTLVRDGDQVEVIPGGGSFVGNSKIIPSGQSFFVRAMGSPGQVIFTESCKTLESAAASREATAANSTSNLPKLRSNLSVLTTSGPVLLDGWGIRFDDAYSNGLDSLDILKIGNSTSENMGIVKNGQRLTYERRGFFHSPDTTTVILAQLKRQSYRFEFMPTDLAQSPAQPILVDRYLNTHTPIALDNASTYDFVVTTDAMSSAADRFRIIWSMRSVLPVQFVSVQAQRISANHARISWKTAMEQQVAQFEIERSTDGRLFQNIGMVTPSNAISGHEYHLDDQKINQQRYFYRIREVSLSGNQTYSRVVFVDAVDASSSLAVFPNPVKLPTIQVQLSEQVKNPVSYAIFDISGKKWMSGSIPTRLNNTLLLQLDHVQLPSGQYTLLLLDETGKQHSAPFLVTAH